MKMQPNRFSRKSDCKST